MASGKHIYIRLFHILYECEAFSDVVAVGSETLCQSLKPLEPNSNP